MLMHIVVWGLFILAALAGIVLALYCMAMEEGKFPAPKRKD